MRLADDRRPRNPFQYHDPTSSEIDPDEIVAAEPAPAANGNGPDSNPGDAPVIESASGDAAP